LIDKKTVFVLGAGASCPYGYPSGARLREMICLDGGFWRSYENYLRDNRSVHEIRERRSSEVNHFRQIFKKSNIRSIDLFLANNPKLAPMGKYIIAYEMFRAEQQSLCGEEAKLTRELLEHSRDRFGPRELLSQALFRGGDWYFYLYNRFIGVGKDALPDFSDGNLSFITFNYDRSLEHFFYEALRNSFTEVSEDNIVKSLQKLKILHVYGQIAPLKWQDSEHGVDYRPQIDEPLLSKSADNIKTIFEQKESAELDEARKLLGQADRVVFLGFSYAPENMEVLQLPKIISKATYCYGTAFGLETREVQDIHGMIMQGLPPQSHLYINHRFIKIEKDMDSLSLLKNYL